MKSKDLEHFLFIDSQLSRMMKLRVTNCFKENMGVPFIIAFMIMLMYAFSSVTLLSLVTLQILNLRIALNLERFLLKIKHGAI